MDAHLIFEIVVIVASIAGAISSYFSMRGRHFGLADLALFTPLAGIADFIAYHLVQIVFAGGGESDAYLRLLALLGLFAAIPAAIVCSVIFLTALFVTLTEHKKLHVALLAIPAVALLIHLMPAKPDADGQDIPPPNAMNSKLEGEQWALESGASTPADCDKQSRNPAFREGCRYQLSKAAR